MARGGTFTPKLTRPSVSNVFRRKGLFRVLENSISAPCIWLAGPPGSGKTTLVSSFIEEKKIPCLWYRIDEADNDLSTFFYYMAKAGKAVAPRRREPLPLLTPEYSRGISTFARRFFEFLFERMSVPSYLVFDNYQNIPESSQLHEMAHLCVSCLPSGVRIVFVSRHDMPSSFTRFLVNMKVTRLGWDMLRLSRDEAGSLARLYLSGKDMKQQFNELYDVTDGWVAGLVLLLQNLKSEGGHYPDKGQSREDIFNYFTNEIFLRTDKKMQDFLLRSSFLSSMTAHTAKDLTGHDSAEEMLAGLHRNNFFTEKRTGQETVYHYHALFRDFLRATAERTFSAEDIMKLQARASLLLEESGYVEESAGLYIKTACWPGLTNLIMNQAQAMLMQGRHKVLEGWLRELPEEIRGGNPWLMYWLGLSTLPYNPPESNDLFKKAFHMFLQHHNVPGIFLSWCGVVESISMGMNDYSLLDHWIQMLEELMKEYPSFPSPEIEARVTYGMFASLILRQPHHPRIEEWGARALDLAIKAGDINHQMMVWFYTGFYWIHNGYVAKAGPAVEALRELQSSGNTSPLAVQSTRLFEVLYYGYTGNYYACVASLHSGLEIIRKTGAHIMDFMLYGNAAITAIGYGDLRKAEELLEKMSPVLMSRDLLNISLYHLVTSYLAIIQNNLPSAFNYVQSAFEYAKKAGMLNAERECRFALSNVLHETGRHKEADRQLEITYRAAVTCKNLVQQFACLLAKAYFAFDGRRDHEALTALKKAMALGRKTGYVHYWFWRPDVMSRLCQMALEHDIEVDYAKWLIRKRNLVPESPPLHIEEWPWKVRIYTMGRFGIVLDGNVVEQSEKGRKMPVRMLKVLIALGSRKVSQESIMDILWPDADGDMAYRSFNTNLHRLRKILGHDGSVQMKEGDLTIDPRTCWVDAWAFERMAGVSGGTSSSPVAHAEKCISMYGGSFLPGESGEHWTISMRERLRKKYLHLVETVGDDFEKQGEWKKAVHHFQKGLEVDDLAETFYQRLLTCYGRLGRKAEAAELYTCCRDRLSSSLGIEPSSTTERIYRTVMEQ